MKKRILELSFKHKLSHIGSCLSAVEILESIRPKITDNDILILSQGHIGLALYVFLETLGKANAEELLNKHGVHPNRDIENGIYCSAGSLGHGLPIALGVALGNPSKKVFCIISDGECAEGSIWEALNIFEERQIRNLFIYVNMNGWAAYKKIDCYKLQNMIEAHCPTMLDNIVFKYTSSEQCPFLKGNDAHYYIMTKDNYESFIR